MDHPSAICVYSSSKDEVASVYKDSAIELGKLLADKNISLVYGGGDKGLMGLIAHSCMDAGGKVIGFMPTHLQGIEKPDLDITEFYFVESMHERKQKMFERADAFFILPGGFGTLDEVFEMITWRQIGLHEKPIIFININHYWDPVKLLADNIISQKFASETHRTYFFFANSVGEAFGILKGLPKPSHAACAEWM
ncbi:TIGR00730 family Rossman fold protein [Candidatus Bealeia paramacronuclearis]|uniref:Cytokinin riboside 5'-monophosphate phosphoribohydrolase n=1 Tax=Candidatus Bealeia paramacronuclearis TaxID=1921001 RepID=A0ABZ2C338_9PROT|nr:family Rossman fold protein [Candidatus Bealeia paramacronuclearis]